MAPERSAWRPYFDALERGVGRPLESGVETGTFQDALALVTHLQVAVQRRLERVSSDCLQRVIRTPRILIVMSLISRSYILDRRPGNSFIEHLLKAGYDGWQGRGVRRRHPLAGVVQACR